MNVDFGSVVEIAKDKVGRKHILGLADMGCLTYLIATGTKDLPPLIVVGLVGIVAILAQLAIDWKYPRNNGNGAAKAPNGS